MDKFNNNEVEKILKDTFSTPAGLKALDILTKTFVDRDVYKIGISSEEVAFREGERSMVRKIKEVVNIK